MPHLLRGLVLTVLVVAMPVHAVGTVRVLALFEGMAMLEVDGQRKLLRIGQTGPGGVELVAANAREAVVRIDGREETLQPGGGGISSSYRVAERAELRILRDSQNSYTVQGTVNGQLAHFLIDTGANSTAMSELEARRLGVAYIQQGQEVRVGTASGATRGWRVKLDRVALGPLAIRDSEAVVIEGDSPPYVLLGMNVLRQFDIEHDGQVLLLRGH